VRGRHVRCEVTGHRGEGIDAHPDATVLLEETSVSGDELDGMVGLEGVKKEVRSLVNLQQAGAKREACTDDPFFGFACSFDDTV